MPAVAQSASCNRARAIVEEVKGLYAAPQPNHRAILEKLRTAQQLCPTLGEAWMYAYCSAKALGDEPSARGYRERAAFNNVSQFACGASVPVKPPSLPGYVRQKYALVIGIGEFKDPTIPKLRYAAKDAQDFADALLDPRYGNFDADHVTVLKNKEATRGAILQAMQTIILQAQPDDLVVTYVSSHGSPADDNQGLSGIGYIVTYDTSAERLWLDALDYQGFADKTTHIKALRKVTFLDTCYSGQASRRGGKALSIDGGVDERTARMFLSGVGSFVITSSNGTERSWESEKVHNSYFTYYLIDGIKRAKSPPTVKELFDHLSTRVTEAVARDKQATQHPTMMPSDDLGDVRIGVIPTARSSQRPSSP